MGGPVAWPAAGLGSAGVLQLIELWIACCTEHSGSVRGCMSKAACLALGEDRLLTAYVVIDLVDGKLIDLCTVGASGAACAKQQLLVLGGTRTEC